mgnify:CR=1 FL=1
MLEELRKLLDEREKAWQTYRQAYDESQEAFYEKLLEVLPYKDKIIRIQDDNSYSTPLYIKVEEVINSLPFKLTIDQEKSIKEIYDDLVDEKRMNRLLQGDVGSGKTIVGFISILINYFSGYQSALMAPTEILAYQHYHLHHKSQINAHYSYLFQLSSKSKVYHHLRHI